MEDSTDFTLFARSIIKFSDLAEQNNGNGLFFKWKFYPSDIHGTVALPSVMDGLISLFTWFQMEHTDKFNSPQTPGDELQSIVNYRADKLKAHFGYSVPPYPEDLMNMLGYMYLDMQQNKKSKMFFEFDIKYYPNNPNAYNSMADYYEAQKDYANALIFVSKAYEISGDEGYRKRIQKLKKKN